MKVRILPSFLNDLSILSEPHFARRVLRKCFLDDGTFKLDKDDHRYHGVEDAWVRYVSRGNSAYRVIYIQKDNVVYLYRAGQHSVEDNLCSPNDLTPGVIVSDCYGASSPGLGAYSAKAPYRFLYANRTKSLIQEFRGRRLVPHKEIFLVSPFVSPELIKPNGKLGKILFDLIEDSTEVTLITRPPEPTLIPFFEDLSSNGLNILCYPRLHAKLYVFKSEPQRAKRPEEIHDLYILGSANLTNEGVGILEENSNEELCCELPLDSIDSIETYLAILAGSASDIVQVRIDHTRRNRRCQ